MTGGHEIDQLVQRTRAAAEAREKSPQGGGGEVVAWLYTYAHDGESDHCLSCARFLPSWVKAKDAEETPLYAIPTQATQP